MLGSQVEIIHGNDGKSETREATLGITISLHYLHYYLVRDEIKNLANILIPNVEM